VLQPMSLFKDWSRQIWKHAHGSSSCTPTQLHRLPWWYTKG